MKLVLFTDISLLTPNKYGGVDERMGPRFRAPGTATGYWANAENCVEEGDY